jgi:hypothetical protein
MGWLVSSAALIGAFMPGSSEHWGIYWLPGCLLIVGLGLSEWLRRSPSAHGLVHGMMAAMLVLLLVGNGANILLQMSPASDLFVTRLNWYREHTTTADLVISSGDWMWTGYLEYFLDARIVPLRMWMADVGYSTGPQKLESLIMETRSRGGRVYVTQDALQRDACAEKRSSQESEFFAVFRQTMLPRMSCFRSEDVSVCELVD